MFTKSAERNLITGSCGMVGNVWQVVKGKITVITITAIMILNKKLLVFFFILSSP